MALVLRDDGPSVSWDQDNRINNLELWTRHQPAGQRVEDKVAWAIEFLEQYGYKVTID